METAKVRDWLSELEALVAADQLEAFQAHALVAVKARPDLEGEVCRIARANLDNADAWIAWLKTAAKPEPFVEQKVIDWAAERGRLNKALGAKPKPGAEAKSQPEPEVEPEVEPEREPQAPVQLPAVVPPQPAKWEEAIDLLNTRHAIIDNVGGKTMIASWEPSPLDPSRMVVVFQSKESFLLRYSNRTES
jgi:hypothetical protein